MNRSLALSFTLTVAIATMICVRGLAAQTEKEPGKNAKPRMNGTWQRDEVPEGYRYITSFTETHFHWVLYRPSDGKVAAVAGGTYMFDGKICKKKYEYGTGPFQEYVKQEPHALTITFEKGGWKGAGKGPDGGRISETYRRAK
jgi:hypothetical protein